MLCPYMGVNIVSPMFASVTEVRDFSLFTNQDWAYSNHRQITTMITSESKAKAVIKLVRLFNDKHGYI